jgi:catechol 2,3-dioxygenase-like lactoylglutathione lyase family enzyme
MEQVPLNVTGISHYTISVSDLKTSLSWFQRVLGFKAQGGIKRHQSHSQITIINNTMRLQLVEPCVALPLPPYRSHPASDNAVQGHKHSSLLVNDGSLAETELRALGAKVVFVPRVNETYGIFILDPTGNLIEILQEKLVPTPEDAAAVPGCRPVALHGWSHFCISVRDMDESVIWYRSSLGFLPLHSDTITSPDGHTFKSTWLGGPDFSLEIFEVANSEPLPLERRRPETDILTPGNKYFSLSVERMEIAEARLSALGIEIFTRRLGPPPALFIRDNTGILLELVERGY